MPLFDFPLDKLRHYRSASTEPADFSKFWKQTLAQTAKHPLAAKYEKVHDSIYNEIEVFDLTFGGYLGQPIKGWFMLPSSRAKNKKLPCLVTYIGYGGGRSLPVDHLAPAVAGLAHLVMDTRGQGSAWSPGHTNDPAPPDGGTPQVPGFMTRGLESRETYYYRRVYTDAVRAIEVAAAHPAVDPRRIGITGKSQGGGITIAAAGLAGRKVKIAMPDVPYLCDFRRATTLINTIPYSEITQYLKTHRDRVDQVYRTLAYFDGVHLARRITARCLFSVGLMDDTCPPSTVFAAYNAITAAKDIRIYEFNNHEGGGVFQAVEALRFAVKHL